MVIVPASNADKFNFSIAPEVAKEFRAIGDQQGERNKLRWAVATAAVLKLLEMPQAEMIDLIKKVYTARRFDGEMQALVDAAKAKAATPKTKYDEVVTFEAGSVLASPDAAKQETQSLAAERKPVRRRVRDRSK